MLDHIDNLAADFRVHYRVDDIMEMESASFFKAAYRVFAYKGVMRQFLENEAYAAEKNKRSGGTPAPASSSNGRVEKPLAAMVAGTETSDLFEYAKE